MQLGHRPDATMKLLQSLFEDGHITYHRTDSVALAPEAIDAARAIIRADFKPAYLPKSPVIHATKSANAQEAHEAIRPTHPESGVDAVPGESGDLYRLIWNRFIACQMSNGRDQLTTLDVACAPGAWNGGPMGIFQAKGVVELFDGWRKLGADATEERRKKKRKGKAKEGEDEPEDDDDGVALPMLEPGQELNLLDLAAVKKTTRPPPRFTQASLIKRLEKEGIGRPSTYAAIMGTLLARTYVVDEKRKLFATPLGLTVNNFLTKRYAGNFIELDYTRRMEDELDRIARGEAAWEPAVTTAAQGVLALAREAGLEGPGLG